MTGRLLIGLGCAIAIAALVPFAAQGAEEEDDEGAVLKVEKRHVASIPSGGTLVVRPFSTEGTDFGTGGEGGKESRVEAAAKLKAEAPGLLAAAVNAAVAEARVFSKVLIDPTTKPPAGALVLEGRFLKIDPGSRAKRLLIGFVGSSGVTVEGRLLAANGKVLADFQHTRHSIMGVYGGDYVKLLSRDARDIGKDIGKFLADFASAPTSR
jgi:hypothetical protein